MPNARKETELHLASVLETTSGTPMWSVSQSVSQTMSARGIKLVSTNIVLTHVLESVGLMRHVGSLVMSRHVRVILGIPETHLYLVSG